MSGFSEKQGWISPLLYAAQTRVSYTASVWLNASPPEEVLIADEAAAELLTQTDQALSAIRCYADHTDALLKQIRAVRAETIV